MVRYVHNISMNDHYKFLSIHIHIRNKYHTENQIGIMSQISIRKRELRRALNGNRFQSLFGSRPRCLAPIRITYAHRSHHFPPENLFEYSKEIWGTFKMLNAWQSMSILCKVWAVQDLWHVPFLWHISGDTRHIWQIYGSFPSWLCWQNIKEEQHNSYKKSFHTHKTQNWA